MGHYNRVASDLANDPESYAPILEVVVASDEVMWESWVDGFERAMRLRADAWEGRCHVNHRVTSLWAPTPEIMQRSSLAATVSSRRRGIGGVFGGRPDGVGR